MTETRGCDINKTRAENAKAGSVSDTPAHKEGAARAHSGTPKGTHVAEKACLARVAKTVGKGEFRGRYM